jgi:hypothetical protein
MRKRLISLATLLLLVSTLHINCSKNDDPAPPAPKTKTELISKAAWKFEKIDPALAESYIACFKDNTITFAADGKGTCPDAGVQCNPATGNFNWNFTDNESKLHLDATLIPAGSGDFTIVTLNETNLIVSQSITSPIGPVLITITFKH